jgi:RNA 3'-terminal phosphate cyclase
MLDQMSKYRMFGYQFFLKLELPENIDIINAIWSYKEKILQKTHNTSHPFAFSSSLADNETYTVKEMLQQPDVASFVNTMVGEQQALGKLGDGSTIFNWATHREWNQRKGMKMGVGMGAYGNLAQCPYTTKQASWSHFKPK